MTRIISDNTGTVSFATQLRWDNTFVSATDSNTNQPSTVATDFFQVEAANSNAATPLIAASATPRKTSSLLTWTLPTLALRLAPSTPEDVAQELLQFTLTHKIDKTWLYNVYDKGVALGKVEELASVYHSSAMEDILNHPENYKNTADFLNEMDRRQDDLLASLTFWQKLKYGPRIKELVGDLNLEQDFFTAFAERYAKMTGKMTGEGLTAITSYFFRPDRLDEHTKAIFDLFCDKLRSIVLSEPSVTSH